jgi:uncharacterized protein YejL (UPF0352 family)
VLFWLLNNLKTLLNCLKYTAINLTLWVNEGNTVANLINSACVLGNKKNIAEWTTKVMEFFCIAIPLIVGLSPVQCDIIRFRP